MHPAQWAKWRLIHRHIGGLEIFLISITVFFFIHRHIGGLEKSQQSLIIGKQIHRHIGGLEIK